MSSCLILIPTLGELQVVRDNLSHLADYQNAEVNLCGFGPIASAARASMLIARHNPSRVVLVGIAGTYDSRIEIGDAIVFDSVSCYGVGVGDGNDHQSAETMGWHQWASTDGEQIGDTIQWMRNGNANPRRLLTVCAASASASEAASRQRRFPDAVAEDMEGFGVAMACKMAGVPLTIIRGISNIAGDRDKSHWRIADAMRAVARLTVDELNAPNCDEPAS